MAAVSAQRSPQTWGTRPWQLRFLISRQPPPGPADKGSNAPSVFHLRSTQSSLSIAPITRYLMAKTKALSVLILGGARFTPCSNFPCLSIEVMGNPGCWGKGSLRPRDQSSKCSLTRTSSQKPGIATTIDRVKSCTSPQSGMWRGCHFQWGRGHSQASPCGHQDSRCKSG